MDHRELRKRSKALLGSMYRLEIAVAIARCYGESFTAQSIADDAEIRYGAVQQELKHLERAGMISQLDSVGPTVEYKAAADVYWRSCEDLLRDWREIGPEHPAS